MDKIKVKEITIVRAEGPSRLCDIVQVAESFAEANTILMSNSSSAPKGGAYDKHDFKVVWEDGQEYNGRYDLKHFSEEFPYLDRHIVSFLSYLAGTPPLWMERLGNEEALKRYKEDRGRNPEEVQNAKDFMEKYELSSY